MLGMIERQASEVERLGGGPRHGAVIRVRLKRRVRILGDDHIRSEQPDGPDELLTQNPCRQRVQLPVRIAEQDRRLSTQSGRRAPHLLGAGRDQRFAIGFKGTSPAIGRHNDMDTRALSSQLGEQAAGIKLGVIGVGDESEDDFGHHYLQPQDTVEA